MHSEAISARTKCLLEKIKKSNLGEKFYLAGGTALAIQLGHRESIDLDWFSDAEFSSQRLKEALAAIGRFELASEEEGTIHGLLDGIRISFFLYKYNLLFPLVEFDGIRLADERDIAAMKLDAISSRGSRKDFLDFYFLLEKYSLDDLIVFFEKKFSRLKFNKLHLLKSLTFFEDADVEPEPIMLKSIKWKDAKSRIRERVREFLEKKIAE